MSSPEIEPIRISRRRVLIGLGTAVVGLVGVRGGLYLNSQGLQEYHKKEEDLNTQFPKIYTDEEIKSARLIANKMAYSFSRLATPTSGYAPQTLEENLQNEDIKKAIEVLSHENQRVVNTDIAINGKQVGGVLGAIASAVGIFTGLYTTAYHFTDISIFRYQSKLKQKEERKVKVTPETFLPPVGGKIVAVDTGNGLNLNVIKLKPTILAEEQISPIINIRQSGGLGIAYVHQMTVQGRLPDVFKYVPISLLLHSPWEHDWNSVKFEYWSKDSGPLVYDGGVVDYTVNPLWKEVHGRTDFMYRAAVVAKPDLEIYENEYSVRDAAKLDNETLNSLRLEQQEKARLLFEEQAYQRLGFACHCETNGDLPNHIPSEIREAGAKVWRDFVRELTHLMSDAGLYYCLETRWIEGRWERIQTSLMDMERAHRWSPDLRQKIDRLLLGAVNSVDELIRLKP